MESEEPSQLFWYIVRVKFRPYHFEVNPADKIIVDNIDISKLPILWIAATVSSFIGAGNKFAPNFIVSIISKDNRGITNILLGLWTRNF